MTSMFVRNTFVGANIWERGNLNTGFWLASCQNTGFWLVKGQNTRLSLVKILNSVQTAAASLTCCSCAALHWDPPTAEGRKYAEASDWPMARILASDWLRDPPTAEGRKYAEENLVHGLLCIIDECHTFFTIWQVKSWYRTYCTSWRSLDLKNYNRFPKYNVMHSCLAMQCYDAVTQPRALIGH